MDTSDPLMSFSNRDEKPWQLVRRFEKLAPWWLSRTTLEKAARNPAFKAYLTSPNIRPVPGSCRIVFAGPQDPSPLRRAFQLPLRWVPDTDHSDRLPPSVRKLGDLVLGQLKNKMSKDSTKWGLHFEPQAGLDSVDLGKVSPQQLLANSGWLAVYGGLRLALQNRTTDLSVWASVAFDKQIIIRSVDRLGDKLGLAVEEGGDQFFLPTQNMEEALRHCEQNSLNIQLRKIDPQLEQANLDKVLEDYLVEVGIAPGEFSSFDERRKHYSILPRRRADAYYWDFLLDDVIKRCQERFRGKFDGDRPTHLITVVGNTPNPIALGIGASGVRECLLVYEQPEENGEGPSSNRIVQNLKQLSEFARVKGIEPTSAPITLGNRTQEINEIRKHLENWKPSNSSNLLVDLTPGYKSISFALEHLVNPNTWLMYCRHQQLTPDNRVDPGTEDFECWRVE